MIFVVDDENDLRELIQYTLSTKDLASKGFDNPLEMLNELNKLDSKDLPKLILLDVGLPQISGIDTLKKLKQKSHTRDIPVIMLTAKNSEIDKVNGLMAARMTISQSPLACWNSWRV